MSNYYPQLLRQKNFYDSLQDPEKKTLAEAEWLPERLAALNSSSGAEQERLKGQLTAAQQMVSAPIQAPQNSSAGVVIPTVLGNALRTFGGAFLANRESQNLADAQAKANAERERLIRTGVDSTAITKRAERNALARALEELSGGSI